MRTTITRCSATRGWRPGCSGRCRPRSRIRSARCSAFSHHKGTFEATSWSLGLREAGTIGPALGFVGLVRTDFTHRSSEVFYELLSAHWGKGFMTEALQRIIQHAFEALGLHRLEGRAHPSNQRSIKVLERCGYQREGVLRESYFLEGMFYDSLVYGLLNPNRP